MKKLLITIIILIAVPNLLLAECIEWYYTADGKKDRCKKEITVGEDIPTSRDSDKPTIEGKKTKVDIDSKTFKELGKDVKTNKEAALAYVEENLRNPNLSYEERCYWAMIHAIMLERQGLAPVYIIEKKKMAKMNKHKKIDTEAI
jgi:hypothetical protein